MAFELRQSLSSAGGWMRARASEVFGDTAHKSASLRSAAMSKWRPRMGSANADLLRERGAMVSRARDIDRNNGVAKGGIQTLIDNVVGTGFRLSARPNYLALGQTKEWQQEWGKVTESLFCDWFWSTACHAGDTLTGDQLTQQVFRSQLTNGEATALPMWIDDRGDGFGTKIQLVESDRLMQPMGQTETVDFHAGIQYDVYGAPITYYFRTTHPGDTYGGGMGISKSVPVPRRFPNGRVRVLHIFDQERPGQSRGKPVLQAVLSEFKQLDRYKDAEIMAAVVNAMVAMTIETPMDYPTLLGFFDGNYDNYARARSEHSVSLEAGQMIPLFPGDKMNGFLPNRPASGFGAFCENIYRIIGVALDIPYELVLKDFSQTNYSSARAALLEAWRSFNRRRDLLATQWMDPLYALFIEEMIDAERIVAPGFYENRGAYLRCRWIGPGRGWVDPVKEIDAAALRLANNLSSLEDECAEQGKDWREVLEQRAIEFAELERLGLPTTTTAQRPVGGYPSDSAGDSGAEAPPKRPKQPNAPESGQQSSAGGD